MEANRVYHGDVVDLIKKVEDSSCHLIIADPPYNLGKDFGNDSDFKSYTDLKKFSKLWIKECIRCLHRHGTLMIYGKTPLNHFMWTYIYEELGVHESQLRELIWYYTNNKSNVKFDFYQSAHENILVYFNSRDKHFFNKDDVRQPYETNYASLDGKRRVPTQGRFGNRETIYRPNPRGADPKDVLKIGALSGRAAQEKVVGPGGLKHPTQKPVKLSRWLIQGSSMKGQRVLVPFAGSGTECIVAYEEGREFIGFELNALYIQMIATRFVNNGYWAEFREIEGRGLMYVQG